jgi:hypothetical protein
MYSGARQNPLAVDGWMRVPRPAAITFPSFLHVSGSPVSPRSSEANSTRLIEAFIFERSRVAARARDVGLE